MPATKKIYCVLIMEVSSVPCSWDASQQCYDLASCGEKGCVKSAGNARVSASGFSDLTGFSHDDSFYYIDGTQAPDAIAWSHAHLEKNAASVRANEPSAVATLAQYSKGDVPVGAPAPCIPMEPCLPTMSGACCATLPSADVADDVPAVEAFSTQAVQLSSVLSVFALGAAAFAIRYA
jgi:hypothetical protein